ncbi:RacGEF [Acrasis kona]|uniref:RacGEF n=1 Tax=Acrasis kona TaxID=1008807 RepID=A0AAW2YWW2_9EUKA
MEQDGCYVPANYVEEIFQGAKSQIELWNSLTSGYTTEDAFRDGYSPRLMENIKKEIGTSAEELTEINIESETLEKRYMILKEFLDTEKQYVSNLHTMIYGFAIPIKTAKAVTDDVHDIIFKKVNVLIKINGKFLLQISQIEQMKQDVEDIKAVSSNFITTISEYLPSFKLYTDYINNYPRALQVLQTEVEKNKKLRAVLDKQRDLMQSMTLRNSDLESFMIVPIQRIPRYQLLLKDLLKTYEESESDFEKVKKTVFDIGNIADYCNEKRREFEQSARMMQIISDLKLEDFISPNRRFLHEEVSTNMTVSRNEESKSEKCDVYIFNDAVVIVSFEYLLSIRKDVILLSQIVMSTELSAFSVTLSATDKIMKTTFLCVDQAQHDRLGNVLAACLVESTKVITPTLESRRSMDSENTKQPGLIERMFERKNIFKGFGSSPRDRSRSLFSNNKSDLLSLLGDDDEVITEGYMIKQGHVARNWKKRYFVLKKQQLIYYENDTLKNELGSIFLKGATLSETVFNAQYAFCVWDRVWDKKYVIQCHSEKDYEQWLMYLNKAVQNLADYMLFYYSNKLRHSSIKYTS